MASEFVQVKASEQEDLIRFLLKSLGGDATTPSFRPGVMKWKYFVEHPQWKGARSFAFKRDGVIVAHGGVWPVTLVTPRTQIKAIHLIDWAAAPFAVGAGVQLLRQLAPLADVLITIGGSNHTRTILPKLGYTHYGELCRFARVVKPWMQLRNTPGKSRGTWLKFLRNCSRALRQISAAPNGWRVVRTTTFRGSTEINSWRRGANPIASWKTTATLDYLLGCPAATVSGYLAIRERLKGYFLVARIGHQARIIDLCINSEDETEWHAGCVLAARTAAQDNQVCEIVAASSNQMLHSGWLQAGFTLRRTDPIFCYDPQRLIPCEARLALTLADGDQCFLSDRRAPYLS